MGVRLRPVPGADSCWTCTQPGLLQQRDAQGLYHYDRVLEPSSTTADVLEAIGEDRFLCALQVQATMCLTSWQTSGCLAPHLRVQDDQRNI